MKKRNLLFVFILCHSLQVLCQSEMVSDTLTDHASLAQCVHHALLHQSVMRQSQINEQITGHQISARIADWHPQLNFGFLVQHNPELPVSISQGNPVHIGVQNVSTGAFTLFQTIFNRDVLLASSTVNEVRRAAAEQTTSGKIDVVVNVSKAYYAVLVTREQIDLFDEDIARLEQSQSDAFQQYKSRIMDKMDYQ